MAVAKSRWALSIGAITLLLAASVFMLHGYRPDWFEPPVRDVTAEEYRVFSGFLNDFLKVEPQPAHPENPTKVRVVNETFARRDPGKVIPLDVVSLGSEQMGRDFYRKNRKRFTLKTEFDTNLSVELVSNSFAEKISWGGFRPGIPDDQKDATADGVFALSRPGVQ